MYLYSAAHGRHRTSYLAYEKKRCEPEKDEKSARIGDRGDHHAGAERGIAPEFFHEQRDGYAHDRREQQIEQHGRGHHDAKLPVVIDQKSEKADDAAPDKAVQNADANLFHEQLTGAVARDLPERESAKDHRDRLITRIAADAGNYWHQSGQRHEL